VAAGAFLSDDLRAALTAAPDPETAALNARLAAQMAAAPAQHEVPVEVTRAARAEGRGLFPPGGPLDACDWLDAPLRAGRIRVAWPDATPAGAILRVHGGGWTFGAPEQHDLWNLELARASGWAVAAVAYRLAPENPWPAPVEDVEEAAAWLIGAARGLFGTDRLAIGGDSAGAHLSAAALLRLRDRGRAGAFRGAVYDYGVFDLRLTPSMRAHGPTPLVLSTPTVDWFADNLTGGDAALRADPAASPLLADLRGMPPALVQIGTADPLLDDSLFWAARLSAAGVPVRLAVWPGGVHAFDRFDTALARTARAEAAAFLRGLS
jgi:acetyl esterase/lipase